MVRLIFGALVFVVMLGCAGRPNWRMASKARTLTALGPLIESPIRPNPELAL